MQADKHHQLFSHFSASLGTPSPTDLSLNWEALQLPHYNFASLDEEFSEDEIRRAVFDFPLGKQLA